MKNDLTKALAIYCQLSLNMIVPIVLCLFIGKWLDQKFNKNHMFLLIFTFLGILSAFRNLYVTVIKDYLIESKKELPNNEIEQEKD